MTTPTNNFLVPLELERTVVSQLSGPSEVYYQPHENGLWLVGWTDADGVFQVRWFNESVDGRWTMLVSYRM